MNFNIPSKYSIDIKADNEGNIGRQCTIEECKKFFKVNANDLNHFIESYMYCPYCGNEDRKSNFITDDQKQYAISTVSRSVVNIIGQEFKKLEIKPNPISLISFGLVINYSVPEIQNYMEKDIKRVIRCKRCNTVYSTYDVSYFCPFCGDRDPLDILLDNLNIQRKFLNIDKILDKEIVNRILDEGFLPTIIESTLKNCVTEFESYCKKWYLEKKSLEHPNSDKHSFLKQIGTTFQNIEKSDHLLSKYFNINCKLILSKDEFNHIKKSFSKRHVLIHNSGIIDKKYLLETNEDPSLLNKHVIISKEEIENLILIIQKIILFLDKFR